MSGELLRKRNIDAVEGQDDKDAKQAQIERAKKSVQENEVGISQYLNSTFTSGGGFFGTIKQRYSDFLVNEVDINGSVVHLVDEGINLGKTRRERKLEKRQKEREELQSKSPEEVEAIKVYKREEAEQKPKHELTDEYKEQLLKYITSEELDKIIELFSTGNNMETKTVIDDKLKRADLHKLLREAFDGKLESVTSPENTFRVIMATNSKRSRKPNPQESINHVDENGVVNYGLGPFKNFLHFTVYKENRETMEVASTISKFLRIPSKSIRFAGTKDRRGVTCQRFCIHKGKVARVSSLNKGLKNTILGGFAYEDYSLRLGKLQGNEFIITIRDVCPINEGETIEVAVKNCFDSLESKGFINYYGMQRFGTFSISTHVLGIKILQEDWKGAAELLLSEQEIVSPDSIDARRCWAETKDPKLTLSKLPRRFTAEYEVLKSLANEDPDENKEYGNQAYFKSLMSIPRNLRIMYAHAYQSYIWNLAASKRIELFGLQIQEGDLVIDDQKNAPETTSDDPDFEEDVLKNKFIRARTLTKEDAESGKYSIYDIVLPTPGFDIIYPNNPAIYNVYVEAMNRDQLDPERMSRKVREFSLAGSYRNVIEKPKNLSYDIVDYEEYDAPLIRTDLELLRLKKEGHEKSQVITSSTGARKAVVLRMQLAVSSYATMALREFMKADTSRMSENLDVRQ